MNIHFIKSPEKKRIIESLNEQFGITKIPHLLIESGKEKIRGYSGHLSKEEILQIGKLTRIESLGLYLIKQEKDKDFRLSLDALHLFKDQITKNIIEISKEQLDDWLHGSDLNIECPAGVKVISYLGDFVGCGVSNSVKIFNYLPKDRRLRN